MHNLSVSVIVPVYNMEKYLKTCIESLLNQTYKFLSIIVVNDASTDESLTIMKNYERRYPKKITVIDSKKNLMLGGARNLGIKSSQSDYIGFVDADDYIHPQMYQLLMKEAQTYSLDVVYCRHENVDENLSLADIPITLKSVHQKRKIFKTFTTEERMKMIVSRDYGSVWAGVYRRSLIEENGLFFPEHLAYEDNYWVYSLLLIIRSLAIISQRCYYYRIRDTSLSHKKNSLRYYDRIEISKRFLDFVKRKGLLEKYQSVIEYIFIDIFTLNSCSMFVNSFDNPQIDKIEEVKAILKKEFPKWRNNSFYKNSFTLKKKIQMNLIMRLSVQWYINLMKLKALI